ncbi:MAG: hypothetical protein ACKOQ7_06585 [Actinomycetota bacterium]
MLLAELEIFHSRPIAPTRRLALGHLVLPVAPAPGFGGVLLGGVLSAHMPEVDDDLHLDVQRLLNEIERGSRVVQPRLRHRFQVDRHGLSHSVHRLTGEGDSVTFDLRSNGTGLQQVLGAIYALERLDAPLRRALVPMMRRSLTWRGPLGANFIAHLAGTSSSSVAALADPRAWALDVLGFPGGTVKPSKREIMSHFRESMRRAHPDHGGNSATAAKVMSDITEARRVLLDSL